MSGIRLLIARCRRFSACDRSLQQTVYTTCPYRTDNLPEPEARYGLSLAHNDAFATIARSTFLACTFVSASEIFANPFDFGLFRSVRFRGRIGAMSTPKTRYPRQSPTLLIYPRSPLPFRSSCENPPDQSVQPASFQEARLAKRSIASYSPPLPLSIPLQINAQNSLRSV